MAQLNDLLVMGQSTLLGPVDIKSTVTAEKFIGDGSELKNILVVESFNSETGELKLTAQTNN